MQPPRIIAHPVMGWFVIILLATIAAVPPIFFFVSERAAELVSIVGTLAALNYGVWAVVWDWKHRYH
jgi:hypothetical protein